MKCWYVDNIPESVFLQMIQDLKVNPIIKVICLRPKTASRQRT